MKYSPYPLYKSSGIEWLDEVPKHWEVKRLKNIIDQPITDGPHLTPAFVDEGVPFISVDGIQDGELVFEGCRFVSGEDHDAFSTKASPKRDDILMGKAASTGKIARVKVDFKFSIWSPLALIRTEVHKADPRFTEYSLKSKYLQSQIDVLCTHNTQSNISMDDIQRLILALPDLPEQSAIADFLDAETAKLDTLVQKERALIEKLKEKRAALISRTVTRGLPPDAARAAGLNPQPKFKTSGIEWLGNVPEHWRVKAVKHLATVGNGSTPRRDNAEYWEDGSYPWLNSSVVNQVRVTEAEEFVTDAALAQCHLPRISPPAVLVGITGEGKTRGMATTLCIEATINQHLAYINPRAATADVGYLHRIFERAYLYLRNESDGGGSTKGAITCEQIANLIIPVPSFVEQRAISNYLDRETAKIDSMVEKVEEVIARLQEYRTALITAAVTGKIDVRGVGERNESAVANTKSARIEA